MLQLLKKLKKNKSLILKYNNSYKYPRILIKMLIKKEDARKHENSKTCTVWEYDHPTKELSYATAKINGRYPEGHGGRLICLRGSRQGGSCKI